MVSTETETPVPATDGELVEAFLTAFVGGDYDAIENLVTDDCVLHQPRWPLDVEGKEAIVAKTRESAGMLADVEMTVQQMVAADDRVAAYVTASGRNVGPLGMGDREIAPTGRRFSVPQFGIYRVENGRIAEAWVLADALGMVEQLDNLPTGPAKMLEIGLRQVRWRLGGRKHFD